MSYFGQSIENESFNTLVPIERFYPDLAPNTVSNATSESSSEPLFHGTRILYWYHPDYVSNVDLVTDVNGEAYELFLYNAWGESLHHWTSNSSNSWSSPYRFNSKELDPETGMHYYGARYHHPKLSVWMSVDPLAHITLASFQYTGNNPINMLDPDGQAEWNVNVQTGEVVKVGNRGDDDGQTYINYINNEGHQLSQENFEGTGFILNNRTSDGEDWTTGEFQTYGGIDNPNGENEVEGNFLEPGGPSTADANQDQRIPEGTYELDDYESSKYPDNYILSNNEVSQDRLILIHTGNDGDDTEGCLLPGSNAGTNWVGSSNAKFNELSTWIDNQGVDNIRLIIINTIDDD